MSVTPTLLDNREPDRQPTMQLEDSSLSAVLHVLGAVESSADPKTVFLSVARAAVPVVCDSVTVVLEADREQRLHFSHPAGATEPAPVGSTLADGLGRHHLTGDSVITPIENPGAGDQKSYRGALIMTYQGYRPSSAQALIGHLLVTQANSIVQRERLADKAAHLERALASNREIGSAMGILMINHKITGDQAFNLLRRTSQHGHRKLSAVAYEVVQMGLLELPADVSASDTAPAPTPSRRARTAGSAARQSPGLEHGQRYLPDLDSVPVTH